MIKGGLVALCKDILTLCDGYGCAFLDSYGYVCMLEAGHEGPHRDEFEHVGKSVVVKWNDTDDSAELIADDEHLSFMR